MNSRKTTTSDLFLVRLSIFLPLIMFIIIGVLIFANGFTLKTIYMFLRVTGWGMLSTFLLSFGASTMYYFLPGRLTGWLLRQRKYTGISFSVIFFIHFFGLFLKFLYNTPFFIKDTTIPEYILGIVAIGFTGAMAVTSTDRAQKEMGMQKWSRLHTIGGNCLLYGFWITYLDHDLNQLPIFLLINGLIILRSVRRMQIIQKTKKIFWVKLAPVLAVIAAGAFIGFNSFTEKEDGVSFAGLEFKARDYYPLYEGNSWAYRVEDSSHDVFVQKFEILGTENVAGRETRKVYFSDDGYKSFAYDETGIRKYKEFDEGRIEIYDPPASILPDLVFNVRKKFSSTYTEPYDPSKKQFEVQGEAEYKVVSVEDVFVKAGQFRDCLRVEYYDKWVEPDGSYDMTTSVIWFAKNVGIVKEISQSKKYDPQTNEVSRYQENAELIEVRIRQWAQ